MYKCNLCNLEFSNSGGYNRHYNTCKKIQLHKAEIIDLYTKNLWSLNDIKNKFKLGSEPVKKILKPFIRTKSESNIVARTRYPEKYKHTEITKNILREKRLFYMKQNPDKTAWRLSNMSYPEILFFNKLIELEWDKLYSICREFHVHPFFIDFAFLNEKLAVEIDGSQHLNPTRKKRDRIKDDLLLKSGWSIFRVSETEIKHNLFEVFKKIEQILFNSQKPKNYSYGIVVPKKNYEKKIKTEDGLTLKQKESIIFRRKIVRPSYDVLMQEITNKGYVQTAKKYGVSDNTIRKWKKFYEKYGNI
jgi:very-short-patch-repair endonuclease